MPVLPARVDEVEALLRYPGQMVFVYCSDDSVWHERLLLWKVQEKLWYILTPDGDVYQESFELNPENGPSKYSIQGVHFNNRSQLRKPVYRFRQPLSRQEFRDRVAEAIRDLGNEVLAAGAWRPDHMVMPDGTQVNPYNFLGDLLGRVRLPMRGGVGIVEGTQDDIDLGALDLHTLKEAPTGFFWAFDDHPEVSYFGTELDVSLYRGFRVGDYDGMVKRDDR